jgi:hypothetical protein
LALLVRVLRALFGLRMSHTDMELYKQCTGRDDSPTGGVREAWLICGRRAGKSFVLAVIAVFLACFCEWSRYLSPGERGTIMVLAADRRQARTICRYAHALLTRIPRRSVGSLSPALRPGRQPAAGADTRTMNPTVPQSVMDKAMEADPASAAAEYGAQSRTDVETYIAREVVDAAIVPGRFELPPLIGANYIAFVDPSGGTSDSMTLAIAHREKHDRVTLDAVRERRPPFSPDDVVLEFVALLNSYNIRTVRGDRYAGEWPRERFRAHGITHRPQRPSDRARRD